MPKGKKHGGKAKRKPRGKSQASSGMMGPATNSQLWNAVSQQWPHFNNTLKKDNSIHKFVQLIDLNTVMVTSSTVAVAYSRAFTFADLPQQSTIASLFDQYKITEIEVWFNPGQTNSSSFTPGTSGYVYTVTDYDDAASLTSNTQALQYTNVMQSPSNMGHYRRWKPHVAEALYGSGAFTSYGNISAPWIDMASPNVQHYGFKAFATAATNTASQVSYSLTVRFHFETRNVF
jgi:hypothetical protein